MSVKGRTIVLIHGLWVTPLIWEPFFKFYGNLGHHVLAPAWPGIDGSIVDTRRDASALKHIGTAEVVAHYARIIRTISEPPFIIGHCYGGTIAQLLIDQGLGAAAVAIGSILPRGFPLRSLGTSMAWLPLLARPGNWLGTFIPTFGRFWRFYSNTLPEIDARKAYERHVVPAPGRLLFQAALASFTRNAAVTVDFQNPDRAPLLFIGGGQDTLVPPALNRSLARRHRTSPCVAEYMEFPGRSHYLIAEQGWQEVADYALRWLLAHPANEG